VIAKGSFDLTRRAVANTMRINSDGKVGVRKMLGMPKGWIG